MTSKKLSPEIWTRYKPFEDVIQARLNQQGCNEEANAHKYDHANQDPFYPFIFTPKHQQKTKGTHC